MPHAATTYGHLQGQQAMPAAVAAGGAPAMYVAMQQAQYAQPMQGKTQAQAQAGVVGKAKKYNLSENGSVYAVTATDTTNHVPTISTTTTTPSVTAGTSAAARYQGAPHQPHQQHQPQQQQQQTAFVPRNAPPAVDYSTIKRSYGQRRQQQEQPSRKLTASGKQKYRYDTELGAVTSSGSDGSIW